jgi:hypothetical protein
VGFTSPFESKWVRLGVGFAAAFCCALAYYALLLATWSAESEFADWILFAGTYALPGIVCGAVAWYSGTIWSAALALPTALLMREVIVPCVPDIHQNYMCTPATASIGAQLAVTLPILFCWAAGYWLGRRRAS